MDDRYTALQERSTKMKTKNLFALTLALSAGFLAECSEPNITTPGDMTNPPVSGDKATAMVVYFSATGHTEEVAQIISDYIDSPLHALEPVEPYTSEDLNYGDSESRVSKERNDPNHVTPLVTVNFAEFAESDYIFLGAPVWWGELSWVIDDFVLSNDFTGKTIIPFATASSSDFSVEDLRHLSDEATWMEGRRFRQSEIGLENVQSWVDSLGIAF